MSKKKSQSFQFISMESGKILRSSLLKNVAGIPFSHSIFIQLFLMTIFSISMTGGNPVKGKHTFLISVTQLCLFITATLIIEKNDYLIMAFF